MHACKDSYHYLLGVVPIFTPAECRGMLVTSLLEKNGTAEADSDPDSSGALFQCRSWI